MDTGSASFYHFFLAEFNWLILWMSWSGCRLHHQSHDHGLLDCVFHDSLVCALQRHSSSAALWQNAFSFCLFMNVDDFSSDVKFLLAPCLLHFCASLIRVWSLQSFLSLSCVICFVESGDRQGQRRRQSSQWVSRHSIRVRFVSLCFTSSCSCENKDDAKKEADLRRDAVKTAGEAEGVTWDSVLGDVDMISVLPVAYDSVGDPRVLSLRVGSVVFLPLRFLVSKDQRCTDTRNVTFDRDEFPIRPYCVRVSRRASSRLRFICDRERVRSVWGDNCRSSTFDVCSDSHVKFWQWWFTMISRVCGVQWLVSHVCQHQCFPCFPSARSKRFFFCLKHNPYCTAFDKRHHCLVRCSEECRLQWPLVRPPACAVAASHGCGSLTRVFERFVFALHLVHLASTWCW